MPEFTVPIQETGPVAPTVAAAAAATPPPANQAAPAVPPQTPSPTPAPQPPPPAPTGQAPEANQLDQAASKFTADAGLDLKELSRQVAETGTVNPEALAKLEAAVTKAGLPKEVVQEYIAGKKAAADGFVQEIYGIAGGQQEFQAMGEWARKALPPDELKMFSDLCESGSQDQARFAVKSLAARYKAENRQPGRLVKGGSAPGAADTFQSFEQQVAAQRDPRYNTDPAFRTEVCEKILRTMRSRGKR